MTPSQAAQEKPTSPRTEHGVGFVDKVGIECLCRWTCFFDRGGWVAFNDHLREAAAATPSLPMAAIRASCQWVEENIAPKRCDNEGVSDCWRCNTVFLARTLARLDEGSATPDQGKGEPPDPIDNQHPLIRAIADLPRHADEPGQDYVKRGGALAAALNYLWADQGKGEPR